MSQPQAQKPQPPVARKEPAPQSPVDEAPSALDAPSKTSELAKLPKYEFTIPESARIKDADPKKVVIRELTEDDMDLADRLSKGQNRKVGREAVKMSLWSVDGRLVDHSTGEGDFYWAKWGMKVKVLLLTAWSRIHQTDDAEDQAFFESMRPVK